MADAIINKDPGEIDTQNKEMFDICHQESSNIAKEYEDKFFALEVRRQDLQITMRNRLSFFLWLAVTVWIAMPGGVYFLTYTGKCLQDNVNMCDSITGFMWKWMGLVPLLLWAVLKWRPSDDNSSNPPSPSMR